MAFKFEQLKVWQKALELSENINELAKEFPRDEIYVLSTQIKRAADSVALNIAEGSTGQTNADFKRFLSYAIRSAIEVVACLHIGKRRKIISDDHFQKRYAELEAIIKMLQALRNSLE
jgi:four helix bundle protein